MKERRRISGARRDFLKTVGLGAGAAVAGAAGGGWVSTSGLIGEARAAAKAPLEEIYKGFGKYVFLVPGKFAGTVSAVDLSTGKTLAWMAFWNYGDTCPIMHHLAAFPSPDPYKGFEFIVDTQGGKNLFIYGIPTTVKNPGEGFKIYKVRYDGTKMNLVSEISEKTGLGLGVHVTVSPDGKAFAIADGQKDIVAEFDRDTEKVNSAWFFDWEPNNKELSKAWGRGSVRQAGVNSSPAG